MDVLRCLVLRCHRRCATDRARSRPPTPASGGKPSASGRPGIAKPSPTTSDTAISAGWAFPPKDYAKWAELVFQWVRHSVSRYGRAAVAAGP